MPSIPCPFRFVLGDIIGILAQGPRDALPDLLFGMECALLPAKGDGSSSSALPSLSCRALNSRSVEVKTLSLESCWAVSVAFSAVARTGHVEDCVAGTSIVQEPTAFSVSVESTNLEWAGPSQSRQALPKSVGPALKSTPIAKRLIADSTALPLCTSVTQCDSHFAKNGQIQR